MSFYMATTSIDPEKTAMEVGKILAMHGATETMTVYDKGIATALSFRIFQNGKPISFQLPIRADKVLIALKNDRKTPRNLCQPEQATRVAWRLVLRWVQAQLALVEVGAVDLVEVFLPYAHTGNGKTFYESLVNNGILMLPGGK